MFSSAHDTNKRIGFVLILLVLTLFLSVSALAANDISFTISADPASLTAPGEVSVSLRAVNAGSSDMTEPVTVYDPDGNLVSAFGDNGQAILKAGEYVTAQTTRNVTQAELDEGKITYMLSFNDQDANGQNVVKTLTASAELTYTGEETNLTVKRIIDPEVVRTGKTVSVQYELYNAGNVDITNIRVREDSTLSGTAQTVAQLAPGKSTTLKFTATMKGEDLLSEGKVTYKAGEESYTVNLPAVTIPKAVPGLVLDEILTADRTSIETGETVTLKLSIENKGNISYSNISVTDATYGELFTNLTLGPGETLVREKQFTLNESTTFKFSVTLPDNTGTTNVVSSDELKISVYDPTQVMHLTVAAAASATGVTQTPADVQFAITVTNNSASTAKNISITHGSVKICTISSLEPSESTTITRDFTISQTGKYRFTATTKDALNNTVSFDSNEITIGYAAPVLTATPVPVVTVQPLVTVTVAPVEVTEPVISQANGYLLIAAKVLGAAFAFFFLVFVVSTIVRAINRGRANRAVDHMELGSKRDYTEVSDEQAKEANDSAPVSKPSDEILRAEKPASPAPQSDAGAYHLTREEGEKPAETAKNEEPIVDAPVRHRRSGKNNTPNEDE